MVSNELLESLFDHAPDTAFFVKDADGRYTLVNESLVERCGLRRKSELIGRHPTELFPAELAGSYAQQDRSVIRTGRPILDRLELHWFARRQAGWCLTTKLPLRDKGGHIVGLVGMSRDLRGPDHPQPVPAGLADALDHLENHFDEPLTPASLAAKADLSPTRFARLIRKIYRITPMQLISQTRINAASRLLRETDSSVADIAHACGFYDHSAFTRAFRSATGVTPSEFRKQSGVS